MRLSIQTWKYLALAGIAAIIWIAVAFALKLHIDFLFAIPLVVVGAMMLVYNYKPFFYLMWFAIPCSIPIELGSFATDLFSEPLMWLMLGIFGLNLISGNQFSKKQKITTFHILIFGIVFWVLITTINSSFPLRSFKYFLAKIWYVVAFVFSTEKIIEKPADLKKVFWCFFVPLVVFSLFTTFKHAKEGFTFEASNLVPYPFFVNHVIYGAILTLFVPWIWYAKDWYAHNHPLRYVIYIGLGIILFGVLASYGRLAWGSAVLLPIIVWTVKQKLFDKGIYVGLVLVLFGVSYLIKGNNYYKFAPDYASTIYHEGNIGDHLNATFEGKDISSMERFYRWVAAKNMVAARPIFGFGPSTFNQVYDQYADAAFRTYVSDNEEQSTTHNYFLMTCCEQGFVGFLLFGTFCVFILLKGNRIYHSEENPENKRLIMMLLLSFVVIVMHLFLNELVEVDKVGAMFWFSATMIQKFETWQQEKKELTSEKDCK